MQPIRMLALGCFVLALTGGSALADAKDDAQKALIGKWSFKENKNGIEVSGVVEFTKEGKLSMKMKAKDVEASVDGTYKLLSDTEMEVTVTFNGMNMTDKSKFKVAGDTIEITDKDGKTEKLTRIK